MHLNVRQITSLAVLIAFNIILGKISIGPIFASVNFGFIALVLAGYFYGIRLTALAAVLANLLAFTIMGKGSFSILFLLPAVLAGGAYGFLQKPTLTRIIVVNTVVVVGISFLLNTFLITYTNHLDFQSLLGARTIKMVVSLLVQIIISYLLLSNPAITNLKKKQLRLIK